MKTFSESLKQDTEKFDLENVQLKLTSDGCVLCVRRFHVYIVMVFCILQIYLHTISCNPCIKFHIVLVAFKVDFCPLIWILMPWICLLCRKPRNGLKIPS